LGGLGGLLVQAGSTGQVVTPGGEGGAVDLVCIMWAGILLFTKNQVSWKKLCKKLIVFTSDKFISRGKVTRLAEISAAS
jgi:hypothetical protein